MKKVICLFCFLFFFTVNSQAIQKHETNYLLHSVHDSNNEGLFDGTERQHNEAVYQFGFEHELINDWLLISYTQKSFWQIYNEEHSRQFRETNYNPKLFLRYISPGKNQINFGYEHKSNGQTEPKSRSYDRVFTTFEVSSNLLGIQVKTWHFLIEEQGSKNKEWRKETSQETLGDFYIKLQLSYRMLSGSAKVQRTNEFTAGNNEYMMQLNFKTISFIVYYFEGFGDSLIDYNYNITRTGIGASIDF